MPAATSDASPATSSPRPSTSSSSRWQPGSRPTTRIGVSPLFDPEGNEFAWVVLAFRPFAELAPADADAVTAAIDSAARLADADVFVDPRYGTFDAATGQVVALG